MIGTDQSGKGLGLTVALAWLPESLEDASMMLDKQMSTCN